MGSLPRPRLSETEIVHLYQHEQKSQAWLGLKARLSSARVRDVLVAHGVHIRQSSESIRLSIRARPRKPPSRPVFKGDA
jgi:hypothetical protein